jgi:cytochrome c5
VGVKRTLSVATLALLTAGTSACAMRPSAQPVSRTAEAEALPGGAGKQILQASCTSCHDLGEVTKFRGYYNRAQWHDIVVTMVQYGAEVEEKDVEVLTDYLLEHLGKR